MATTKVKAISAADKKTQIAALKEALKQSQAPLVDATKALKEANQAVAAAHKAYKAAYAKRDKAIAAAAKGKEKIEAQIAAITAAPTLSAKDAKAKADKAALL